MYLSFILQALLEEGENPENYIFDKVELRNINCSEKSLISDKNSKSPSVEKKLSPVIEKKEIKTVSADKKSTTPTKTTKSNVVGRRPGPKSSKF